MGKSKNPIAEQWNTVIQAKISDLRLVADWAAIVGYGDVRDHCLITISKLKEKLNNG